MSCRGVAWDQAQVLYCLGRRPLEHINGVQDLLHLDEQLSCLATFRRIFASNSGEIKFLQILFRRLPVRHLGSHHDVVVHLVQFFTTVGCSGTCRQGRMHCSTLLLELFATGRCAATMTVEGTQGYLQTLPLPTVPLGCTGQLLTLGEMSPGPHSSMRTCASAVHPDLTRTPDCGG